MPHEELTDEEIERIAEEGREAGESAMTFTSVQCPYPEGSESWDIWVHAYRNSYARNNDR